MKIGDKLRKTTVIKGEKTEKSEKRKRTRRHSKEVKKER